MPKLTQRAISHMPAPDPSGKQTLHWDEELKGFAVLCSGTTNAKTYVVQRAVKGGRKGTLTRRLTVGPVNTITLDAAREQAADMINDLRHGIDPKRRLDNATLRQSLDAYLAHKKKLSPDSIRMYRQIERTLAD
jgi:hypothetical protein